MSRCFLEPAKELRVVAALGSTGLGCTAPAATAFTWTADAGVVFGTAAGQRLGEPKLESSPHGNALCFDGVDDGLVFDQNPIAGMSQLTIQVLFRPDAIGTPEAPSEQRFLHFEE